MSVGPSTLGNAYLDGVLNGLESMKLSNSRGSLAASDFEVSSTNKVGGDIRRGHRGFICC